MDYPRDINPALTNNILSVMYKVDEDPVYRQLNKQVYNETAQTFYDNNCRKPITNTEIITYFLTNPKRFGKVVYEEEENEINMIFMMYSLPVFNNGRYDSTRNGFYTIDEEYIHQEIDHQIISTNDIIKDLNIDMDMDLMTIYNITKNRGDCMRVNCNYAKESVIRIFNKHRALKGSFYQIYYYYQYLILNAFVFDILDKQYELIHSFVVKPIGIVYENVDDYMESLLSNPIDQDLYNEQIKIMLNDINELEPKILNYIHTYM